MYTNTDTITQRLKRPHDHGPPPPRTALLGLHIYGTDLLVHHAAGRWPSRRRATGHRSRARCGPRTRGDGVNGTAAVGGPCNRGGAGGVQVSAVPSRRPRRGWGGGASPGAQRRLNRCGRCHPDRSTTFVHRDQRPRAVQRRCPRAFLATPLPLGSTCLQPAEAIQHSRTCAAHAHECYGADTAGSPPPLRLRHTIHANTMSSNAPLWARARTPQTIPCQTAPARCWRGLST